MQQLEPVYRSFVQDCARFEERWSAILADRANVPQWRSLYLTEALLSQSWQVWARFCRSIVLASCGGCVSRGGAVIMARAGDNTWQRVGYEARQAARRDTINPTLRLTSNHQEPVWGDVGKLIDVVSAVAPRNRVALLGAFGVSLRGPKDLQIVRNTCAHLNAENMLDLRKIQIYYVVGRMQHPAEMSWQREKATGGLAFETWLDDLTTIARLACQ